MDIGFVGLGKMGMNMVTPLSQVGHRVVAYDCTTDLTTQAELKGATSATSLGNLVSKLPKPRTVWVMVSFGDSTEKTIRHRGRMLEKSPSSLTEVIANSTTMFAALPTFRNRTFIMSMLEAAAALGNCKSAIA
jgi:6-phosphogluconate dehydrogenase (decarboxylating)